MTRPSMQRFASILLSLTLWAVLSAKVMAYEPYTGWDVLDIGLRGGGTAMLGGQNLHTGLGSSVGLDVDYRLLLPVGNGVGLGPKIGLGATYGMAQLQSGVDRWIHESVSPTGVKMVDTLSLRGKESLMSWQIEMPLMLALNAKGCVINVGLIPVLGLTQQHVTELDNRNAVTFIDRAEVVFPHGLVLREDAQRLQPQFRLFIGAEIGYEWRVATQHLMGVQLYGRYDVLPMQPWSKEPFCAWEGSDLVVGSLTQAFPDKLHGLDFGVRLYYAFASPHNFRRLGLLY